MDPNELLTRIRQQGELLLHSGGDEVDPEEFAEGVLNLLDWLAKGGFAPDWKAGA